MSYRTSLVCTTECDPKRALVSAMRLSGDDDESEDHPQTSPFACQGMIEALAGRQREARSGML